MKLSWHPNSPEARHVKAKLRQRLAELGYDKQALADELGCTKGTIHQWCMYEVVPGTKWMPLLLERWPLQPTRMPRPKRPPVKDAKLPPRPERLLAITLDAYEAAGRMEQGVNDLKHAITDLKNRLRAQGRVSCPSKSPS